MTSPSVPASVPAVGPVLPAAPARRNRWWRVLATKRFLFLSLAVHLLLGAGATMWIIHATHPAHTESFAAGPIPSKAAIHALEHQVKMARKKSTVSAPMALKRITTLSPSKIALPAVPAVSATPPVRPLLMSGMGAVPGAGFGLGSGSGGDDGSGGFSSFIGGMRITAQKLGVALDISGSVRQYQAEMHEYVAKVFKNSQVIEFTTAGFITSRSSMGNAVLDFAGSPQKFDAIYIFSDFGETPDERNGRPQDLWPAVQKLVAEKKVKLYLHVLRKPGDNRISPLLTSVIRFARSTGGSVKVGPMTHVSEGSAGNAASGAAKL